MTMRDLHNNITIGSSVHAVAIGTTGTGKTTAAVDTAGYNGVEFLFDYGAITSATAVYTVLMTECDTVSGSYTSVADTDLLGTEALAALGAATRTDGTGDNLTKKLGYIGSKRFVKAKLSSTATAGSPISIISILHSPRHAPTS
ncbi:MAG: hypothetical protein Q7N50_06495 [Armatimonadota bacterium]|nr:hypothetical protein [Armatimonadota bacterium]